MAKKTEVEGKKSMVLFEGTDELIAKAKSELISKTIGTDKKLKQLVDTYSNLVIAGVEDMASYKVVEKGAMDLKKLRIGIDKYRKDLTAPALKWQKELKAEADKMIAIVQPLEQSLIEKKSAIDDAKKAAEEKLFTKRCKLLADNGYQLAGEFYICGALQISVKQITTLETEEFDFYVNEGDKELKRQKAEQERKDAEAKALQERLDALDKREAEIAAREAKLAEKETEIDAQSSALEQTYEKIEKHTEIDDSKKSDTANETVIPEKKSVPPKSEKAGRFLKHDELEQPEEKQFDAFGDEINQYVGGYFAGFEDMKSRIISLLKSNKKIKRSELVQFIQSQKFDDDVVKS